MNASVITPELRALAEGIADAHPLDGHVRAFSDRPANDPAAMRRFWVRIIRGGIVEQQYEAVAVDSIAAATDAALLANGAKVDVMPMAMWAERQRQWRELTAKCAGLPSDAERVRAQDERAVPSMFERQFMQDHPQ